MFRAATVGAVHQQCCVLKIGQRGREWVAGAFTVVKNSFDALYRQDKRARRCLVAVFTQVDSLPRTQMQPSVSNGNAHARPHHGCFHVGRHVVGPLQRVDVGQRFGDGMVHCRFKVDPDIGIRVLVDGQRGAGVLHEAVQQADLDVLQFGDCGDHLVSNQVKTARLARQPKLVLVPAHQKVSSKRNVEKKNQKNFCLNYRL